MRKLIVLTMISLDGVMQVSGGPEEDPNSDFHFTGWNFPYNEEFYDKTMGEQLGHDLDLLLGRKTYDVWAGYWPTKQGLYGTPFNKATKYVATRSPLKSDWKNSFRIEGDLIQGVRTLKSGDGPELQVHGSGDIIQTLLQNDLVDELWLRIYPLALGTGKRLFAEGTIPAAFKLTKSSVSPLGVIFANYERNGAIKTGSFA